VCGTISKASRAPLPFTFSRLLLSPSSFSPPLPLLSILSVTPRDDRHCGHRLHGQHTGQTGNIYNTHTDLWVFPFLSSTSKRHTRILLPPLFLSHTLHTHSPHAHFLTPPLPLTLHAPLHRTDPSPPSLHLPPSHMNTHHHSLLQLRIPPPHSHTHAQAVDIAQRTGLDTARQRLHQTAVEILRASKNTASAIMNTAHGAAGMSGIPSQYMVGNRDKDCCLCFDFLRISFFLALPSLLLLLFSILSQSSSFILHYHSPPSVIFLHSLLLLLLPFPSLILLPLIQPHPLSPLRPLSFFSLYPRASSWGTRARPRRHPKRDPPLRHCSSFRCTQ
jgi:hypothetical protein